ncbi:sodium channel protein Nach isoform X2 [Ptiloglossa arizonensis]
MVIQFLRRYTDNPTTSYIKSFHTPIFEAPFPAITICPFSQTPLHRRLKILDGVNLPDNVTREIAMTFLKYGHLITQPYAIRKYENMNELKAFLEANEWTVLDFLKILKPCEDTVDLCWWNSERIDCNEFVTISYTSYGLCCSFNYLLEDYVGREIGQPKPTPGFSVGFGRRGGLKLVLKKEALTNENFSSNEFNKMVTNSDGVLVIVHHSMDFPGLNSNTYVVQKNIEMQIGIKPELIEKPEGFYHYNKNDEIVPVCISNNKNNLLYFPTYRYMNCYADCRLRAMIQICGCVPFIFNQIAVYNHLKHCDIDGLTCIQENANLVSIVKDVQKPNFTCLCRSPCQDVTYEGFPNSMALSSLNTSSNYRDVSRDAAVLRVFMKSQVFQMTETLPAADEIYLLASIGGIFSLFLGCSFLSLGEIFYFGGLLCRAIFLNRNTEKPSPKRKRIAHDNRTMDT